MRFVHPALAALVLLPAAAALSACGDPFGGVDALVRSDSVVIASATSSSTRPTAIDIAQNAILTHPELPQQAGAYDVQLRQQGSTFYLLPNPGESGLRATGLQLTTRDIAHPGNAPREVDNYQRTQRQIAVGETYFVQTRPQRTLCGTTSKYAILKVLALQADSGLATLKVVSNQSCDDERLEP